MIKILGHVVAPLHKTNAPLIPIVCDIIFCMLAKQIIGEFSRFLSFFHPKIALCTLDKPLEIDDYLFCPHKKITSRTIRNNGALIVKNFRLLCFVLAGKLRESAKLAYVGVMERQRISD
jgi:hypothetical protein